MMHAHEMRRQMPTVEQYLAFLEAEMLRVAKLGFFALEMNDEEEQPPENLVFDFEGAYNEDGVCWQVVQRLESLGYHVETSSYNLIVSWSENS